MMNALVGRRHNNNDVQKDDEVDNNSNKNDERNQNNAFPANQAARADEAPIKCYNQCKPKDFKGTGGEAENWIRAAERIFKAINCTDAQKVPLAEFSMHGQAQVWWESERELTTSRGVLTQDMFLNEMQNKYVSSIVKDGKAAKFANLVQGSITVTEYDTRFEELSKYAPNTIPTERNKALKFQRGLSKDIKVRVSPLALETYAEVLKSAQLIEDAIGEESGQQSQTLPTGIKRGRSIGKATRMNIRCQELTNRHV